MSLETGDYIIIRDWDRTSFFHNRYYRELENKPTRVWIWGDGTTFIAHPDLDLVPLDDDVIYDKIIDSSDLPDHSNYIDKVKEFDKISSGVKMPSEKPLLKFLKKKNIKEEEEPEKEISTGTQRILNIIDKINNGEMDLEMVEKLFGSIEKFISFIAKKGLLNRINPFDSVYNDIQNLLLYYFVKIDPNYAGVIAEKLLSDITKIGEDYYLDADYSELADLFRTSRNDISTESIEKILSGEYYDDVYSYNSDDVYRDVYDNLDVYAKSVVNEYIVNELKAMGTFKFPSFGKRLPETFEEIAEEQGNEGEIQLTDEVIKRIMTMEVDCLEYLIDRELNEVSSNLNSIYSSCYADALYDEWYNDLWGALEEDVVDSRQGEEYQYQKSVWLRDGTRGTKTAYGKRYKVTKCLFELINGWLDSRKDQRGHYSETIEYFGGYVKLMRDSMDYGPMSLIRVPRLDDYPDHRKMEKCMNENVESYF